MVGARGLEPWTLMRELSVMGIVAPCDHQMMFLVMHPVRYYSDESEPTEFLGVFGGCHYCQNCSSLCCGRGKFPVFDAVHCRGMRRYHPLDRFLSGCSRLPAARCVITLEDM
jgi:hypothetical protein